MQHADNSFVKLPAGTWGQGHTYLDHAGSYHIPGCCDSQVGKVVFLVRSVEGMWLLDLYQIKL